MENQSLKLNVVLEQVGREKNIEKEALVEALESAMLSAARKKMGLDADLEARYNAELNEVEVYAFKRIVKDGQGTDTEIPFEEAKKLDPELTEDAVGEDLGIKLDSREFGRIAAQNAKQIIIQKMRDAERLMVYGEYKDRKGELVTGLLRRFERGNIIVDLGRAEAILPVKEQVQKESFRAGERIVAYVLDVLEMSRGSQIILSRTHPNFVAKLFEQEVPEVTEGIVTVNAIARDAGFRTKIAVQSQDSDVDPVGACVGMKGARVQAVVQELRGEKIDIVPWDKDEARFVCNALAPAEATRVLVNESDRLMQIVVPDDQLSLAIGRRGQNVRLAAELTGWKIDIFSESRMSEERDVAWASLSQVENLSDFLIQTLYNHGFRSVEDLALAEEAYLAALPGFDVEIARRLRDGAATVINCATDEMGALREKARQHAQQIMLVDSVPPVSLTEAPGMTPELQEKLLNFGFEDLADVFYDQDGLILTEVIGLTRAKARQIKLYASDTFHELSKGKIDTNEPALSEEEKLALAEPA